MAGNEKRDILKEARNRAKLNPFFPIDETVQRHNCKTRLLIDRDGSVTEHVALQVADPAHREQLILQHYLRDYAFNFAGPPLGSINWAGWSGDRYRLGSRGQAPPGIEYGEP